LLRMAQAAQSAILTPLAFARLVRINLMHRRRIDRLIGAGLPPASDPRQITLF
ncbi:IS4 family transposase, partial [Inquilinus limosus]